MEAHALSQACELRRATVELCSDAPSWRCYLGGEKSRLSHMKNKYSLPHAEMERPPPDAPKPVVDACFPSSDNATPSMAFKYCLHLGARAKRVHRARRVASASLRGLHEVLGQLLDVVENSLAVRAHHPVASHGAGRHTQHDAAGCVCCV